MKPFVLSIVGLALGTAFAAEPAALSPDDFAAYNAYLAAEAWRQIGPACTTRLPQFAARRGAALASWRTEHVAQVDRGEAVNRQVVAAQGEAIAARVAEEQATWKAQVSAAPEAELGVACEALAASVLDPPWPPSDSGLTRAQDRAFRTNQVYLHLREQWSLCGAQVPGWTTEFGGLLPEFARREAVWIAEGARLYRAILDRPGGRTAAEMDALIRQEARDELFGTGEIPRPDQVAWTCRRLGRAAAGLPAEDTPRPPRLLPLDPARIYVSPRGSFAFVPQRFNAVFPQLGPHLTADAGPTWENEVERVEFASEGSFPQWTITVVVEPGGTLAAAEAQAREDKGEDASLDSLRQAPCHLSVGAAECVVLHEVGYDRDKRPTYVHDKVAFLAHARLYSVSVGNMAPGEALLHPTLHPQFDLEATVRETDLALRTFLEAFEARPELGPAPTWP